MKRDLEWGYAVVRIRYRCVEIRERALIGEPTDFRHHPFQEREEPVRLSYKARQVFPPVDRLHGIC